MFGSSMFMVLATLIGSTATIGFGTHADSADTVARLNEAVVVGWQVQATDPVDPVVEEPIRPLLPRSSAAQSRVAQCGTMQLLLPLVVLVLLSSMRLIPSDRRVRKT